MSQIAPDTKVEVVRKAVDAFRRRDAATLKSLFTADSEFRSALAGGVAEGGVYRGRESVDDYLRDLEDVFEDWHTEDEEYLDAGGDRLLLLYRIVGRGKGSGVPIDQRIAILWTVRGEQLALGVAYLEPEEAMRAAGLAEVPAAEKR
jgi:ketosteroid isomerase-like protein